MVYSAFTSESSNVNVNHVHDLWFIEKKGGPVLYTVRSSFETIKASLEDSRLKITSPTKCPKVRFGSLGQYKLLSPSLQGGDLTGTPAFKCSGFYP